MANGIRVLRITNNLKQDELADLTGIVQPRISIIETGKGRPPTQDELTRIDEAFDYVGSIQEEK